MSSTHRRIGCSICDRCRAIDRLRTRSTRRDTLALILQFLELAEALGELPLSLFLLDRSLTYCEHPLPIDKVACARSAREFAINAFPMLFKVRLNMLQSIKSGHFTRLLLRRRCATGLPGGSSRRGHFTSEATLRWLHAPSFALVDRLPVLCGIL